MILEVYSVLLRVSEPINDPSCDNRVLYGLVDLGLEIARLVHVRTHGRERIYKVLNRYY